MILTRSIFEKFKKKYLKARKEGFGAVKNCVTETAEKESASQEAVWQWVKRIKKELGIPRRRTLENT